MKVTISLDFDYSMKDEVRLGFMQRLEQLGYTEDQVTALGDSFDQQFSENYMDLTFEIGMNDDETECTSLEIVGG
jgi:hypothetical protein